MAGESRTINTVRRIPSKEALIKSLGREKMWRNARKSQGEIWESAFIQRFPKPLVNSKANAILDRIKDIEPAIVKGREFLESGKHADWHGFRPLFVEKVKDGEVLPPHRDWVRNVFLPHHERRLTEAYKSLERVTMRGKRSVNKSVEATADLPMAPIRSGLM